MSRKFYLALLCFFLSGCAQKTGKEERKEEGEKINVEEILAEAAPFLILVPVALGFLVFSVANAQAVNNDEEI
jgi:hypothetical protein